MMATPGLLRRLFTGSGRPTKRLPEHSPVKGEFEIIILDRSGSMDGICGGVSKLEAAKDASIALIENRLSWGADDVVSVISFGDTAGLVLPPSRARKSHAAVVGAIRSIMIEGGTDLNTPLKVAQGLLGQAPRGMTPHLVMLTDGQGGNPLATAKTLKARGAILETVGVGEHPEAVDEPLLKKVASVVNGRVLYRFIKDHGSLVAYFGDEIAGRLVKR